MMESPYLCILYLTTAGQQGPQLGSDEEEIVLLIYIMIELRQNKVVGIQQYIIKPRVADINENILSEQIVTETSLTEDLVKNGIPLETAIEQFEQYARTTFHIVPSTHSLRLVTDGQLPLRQCLHPEACSKDLELPSYYFYFHDLRKQFKTFYSATEEINSVSDMITYLAMTSEPDTGEFYTKDVKDMISITQRLIADGHKFDSPETVNLRLEPGICSKSEQVDDNCVVRARGLPWQSSDQDIAKFFRGLNIAKGGVALCLSPQGRRNGEALVRFVSQEHRDMGLKRHKHHIGNRYIEVYKANGEDFVNVAGGNNSEAQAFLSRGGQVIVRMRGLPYECTAKQVLEFFETGEKSCKVMDDEEGVLFVKKPDGRATGDAFVLFSLEEDAEKALSRHKKLIGSRYIELFRSTTAEVQQVLNRSADPKTYEQHQQPLIAQIPQVPLLPQHIITSGTRKDCIRLRGLPYEAQVEHILEFLGEHAKNIVFQGVHMVYNAQGQPSGEAFIQMDSEHSAFMAAQQKHHRYMIFGKKQRYIEVFQCSGEDMNLVLAGGIPTGAVSPAKAAALLSPGMLPPPPAHLMNPAAAMAILPTAANPIAQPPLAWDPHAYSFVPAQPQVVPQQNISLRPSPEGLWFVNQLAVAQQQQQQQQHQQQIAMAVALAAAAAASPNKQTSWGEINGGVPTSTAVSVSLANNNNLSTPAPQKNVGSTLVSVSGAHTPYGSFIASSAGFPTSTHTHPHPSAMAAPAPSGVIFLNGPPRFPVNAPGMIPSQASTALNPTTNHLQAKTHPPVLPHSGHTHPAPSHTVVPPILQSTTAAAAFMGLKRSWDQAFPTELATSGGIKRQPPPGTAPVYAQPPIPHPAVAYQAQFYPAL